MSLDHGGEMPLLSIQELATRDAPKIYRPHTTQKPAPFDWDAITPTCKDCGTKTGLVNAYNGLCPTCDPTYVAPVAASAKPKPKPVTRPRTSNGPTRDDTPYDTEAAIEAYLGGQLLTEIATLLEVNPQRIRNLFARRNIPLRNDRSRALTGKPKTRGNYRGSLPNRRNPIDEGAMVAEYNAGATAGELATKYGIGMRRVRTTVARHGHPVRDDRKTNSGGRPKTYDPVLVDQVRHLYLDEHLTQSQVAAQLGTTIKIVATIMGRHGVEGRKGQAGRVDGAKGLRQEIAEYGVPVHDIKAWALRQGLLFEIAPGVPPRRVFDAYRAAHDHLRQDGAA